MTAWTDFCKAYALEHKLSYKDAMKAASASYKESGKGVKVETKPEEAKPEEAKVEEVKLESEGVVLEVPQIKHVRKPKKVKVEEKKEAFPLDVEAIMKAVEPEVKAVLEKKKKVKKQTF